MTWRLRHIKCPFRPHRARLRAGILVGVRVELLGHVVNVSDTPRTDSEADSGQADGQVEASPAVVFCRRLLLPELWFFARAQECGACLRAPSQPVPRGPRVGGCPVHQWKRLSEQKIAFP